MYTLCNAMQCIALPFPLPGTYDQPLIKTSNLKQFWTIWQFLAIFDNFFLLFTKSDISGQPWQFLQHFDESKCISTMARMGAAILVASSPPSLSLYWTLLLCSIGGQGVPLDPQLLCLWPPILNDRRLFFVGFNRLNWTVSSPLHCNAMIHMEPCN